MPAGPVQTPTHDSSATAQDTTFVIRNSTTSRRERRRGTVRLVNRALPGAEPDAFVARLGRRITSFPAGAVRTVKRARNELTLPGADAIRAGARRFRQLVRSDAVRARAATLSAPGPRTSGLPGSGLGGRTGSLY